MTVEVLTQANFDETIQAHDCVVVDFWAKWCGPCLTFAPIFEEVSTAHPDVLFAKVDIEQETALAEDFTIRSIPFLMIFRKEFAVFAEAGVQSKSTLHALVEEAKQLDLNELRKQLDDN